jgi:hypothetical protein
MKNMRLICLLTCVWLQQPVNTFAAEKVTEAGSTHWGWRGCFGYDDWDPDSLRKRMLQDGRTSASPGIGFTTIRFELQRGKIDTPSILDGSGNAQFDFDCLQAVLGDSCGSHTISADLTETFSEGDFKKASSLPTQRIGKKLGFYVIPLSISKRFGEGRFFSNEQLLDSSNIGMIPNSSTTKVSKKAIETLRKIYCDKWANVIGEGCRPTLDELLKTKKEILAELESGVISRTSHLGPKSSPKDL